MSRLARLGYIDVRRTSNPVRRKVRSRGVPPALANNEIFYTEDTKTASRLIAKTLGPLHLTVGADEAPGFAATMHGVRLRNVSLLYLDLHVASTVEIPMLGPQYSVHMPMNGRALVEHRGRTFEANTIRSVVSSPGASLRMTFDHDSPQLIIRIEERALAAHLTRLLGRRLDRPLIFEPDFNMATEAAMRWHSAVQLIHTEVFHEGSLIQRGQGIGAVEDFVISSLLNLQPSNYHEEFLAPPPADQRRAVVRNAMNYIDDHLAERITMDAVAKAVHMSVRSIQQGFREELGVSPMSFVRERRLERVHEELTDALLSDGVTVTHVAERWGFHHLGNFAVEYRKRWGETPSETLRR
ncbi:AraC family transcriptional regulator [Mycobacterium sp. CVI_P3]|uniref:AraC family transcriptional regulator n=1 Tax=Mycobacterium pinniadriaticum TaxID=2994102 RepID=A0ABT3SD28_9MYCO|nr:AraC family transcriptional regulator [Mycobacterium pinniadriaticum]MCX2930396.1 AraC family transcriptional regulator [Mycobacterium pinniadriaticum]MCX2936820.1 AraC family transcriptional regulator [Mycobacterium pinniadriaticum]